MSVTETRLDPLPMTAADKQQLRARIEAVCRQKAGGHSCCPDDGAVLAAGRRAGTDLMGTRIGRLETVMRMAADSNWELPRLDRKRIGETFAYVVEVSGAGYSAIESAILCASAIDLLLEDCDQELANYAEFARLRSSGSNSNVPIASRSDWLQYKRRELAGSRRRPILGMRRSRLWGRRRG